jgi:sugar/nucleoside kinase (ribokinase family)
VWDSGWEGWGLQDTSRPRPNRSAGAEAGPIVLAVGAASRDLTPDDPRGWRLGGAVSYGALTLARLGVRTRALVGADAEGSDSSELDLLRSAGAEVSVARLASGPVFRNVETPVGRRQRCLAVSSSLAPRRLPEGWAIGASGVLVAPVAGELDDEWALVPGGAAFVALGWQGALRMLAEGRDVARLAPAARPLLTRANLVGVSVDDVGQEMRLSQLVDLVSAGASVVVTRGDRGGTLLTSRRPARSSLHAYPAIPSNRVVDPTGAGDVFLAALLASIVDADRLGIGDGWGARLTFAAAAASLAVEAPGLMGVPGLDAVRRRVAEVA